MTSPQKIPSLPILDAIRGYACLLVLMGHAGTYPWFPTNPPSGSAGILLFFSLSGFLMSYHYLPGEKSWRYWASFATRRFMRVYPLMLLVLYAYMLMHQFTHLSSLKMYRWKACLDTVLLIKGTSLFWSLVLELKFYLIFIALGIGALYTRREMLLYLAILAFSLMWRLPPDRQTLLPYLPYFLAGMVAGAYKKNYDLDALLPLRWWNVLAVIYVFSQLLVESANVRLLSIDKHYFWLRDPAIRPLWEALTILTLVQGRNVAGWVLRGGILQWLGTISFSIYLLHSLVYKVLDYYLRGSDITMAVCIGVTLLVFAAAMHYGIENPLHRLGKKLGKKILSPPAACKA